MLKIVPVLVNGEHPTYAFIDEGAAASLAAKSLTERLGLKGRPCNQLMMTEAGPFTCREVLSLQVGHIEGDHHQLLEDVFVADKINVTTDHLMPAEWLTRWPHLRGVELHSLSDHTEVELIIGLNSSLGHITSLPLHGREGEPSAHQTPLGWVVFGPTGSPSGLNPVHVHHMHLVDDTSDLLQRHFEQDFWEKKACTVIEDSIEDKRFVGQMKSSVKQIEGKYNANLPFKDDTPLPNNRKVAERRAAGLKKKFQNSSEYKDAYVAQMTKYIDKGYAEPVPTSQLTRSDGRVNYLPHHAVVYPVKGKLRVVFDPKAKSGGTSLNEHLLQGPDLTNSLLGVLLRFREGQHAVTADVQEMFHQVKVPEQDRDVLRFLW